MPGPELEAQLAALRRSYAERLPARVAALTDVIAALAGRWDDASAAELRRELHNLAGSGASYGFPEVSRAARAAEDACAAALEAGAGADLGALRSAVAVLSDAVGPLRG